MKKLVWLGLVVGVLTLTQSVHAIAVKGVQLTVTGDTTYSTSPGIAPKVAAITATSSASSVVTAKVTTMAKSTTTITTKGATALTTKGATALTTKGTTTTTKNTTPTTSPFLSSLSTRSSDLPSFLTDGRTSYTPESLVNNIATKNPTGSSGSKPGSSSGSGSPKTPAPVPDGGATIGLLGVSLLGTVVIKRRLNV